MITFEFSNQSYQTSRVIGDIASTAASHHHLNGTTEINKVSPTVVFFGGIHGNEPSGVVAIQSVFEEIQRLSIPVHGRVLGLAGNLKAIGENSRFIDADLNRIWNHQFTQRYSRSTNLGGDVDVIDQPRDHVPFGVAEYQEQFELFSIIKPIVEETESGAMPFFIDLHTTSSRSEPFIAINDQLENRKFALSFPVPTVLGIEEYLSGPLLSYLNDFGPVAMAFEAGQHEDPDSVQAHIGFIWLSLVQSGVLKASDVVDLAGHRSRLKSAVTSDKGIYEVIFRKHVVDEDHFEMQPGFRNFSPIKKGDLLATDKNGPVTATENGRVFMPLYQKSGNDGFFLVRRVPGWALALSKMLRRFRFENFLVCLPGVSRCPDQPETLIVNKRIAKFLATQIFHLLGYRRKSDTGDQMIFSRREIK